MPAQNMYAPTSHSYNGNAGHSTYDNTGQQWQHGKNENFTFKKRFEHIDWRKIASIDIDQISRTLDFSALQENIMNLTFCNIESELDMRMVDPNFVKLFKMSQFTIEYLLHSQDYLAGIVSSSEAKVKLTEEDMNNLKKEIDKLKEEITETKKESHKRKKLLIAQQQMIHSGSDTYNKCPFCSKAFLNPSFLQSHIFRRHQDYSTKASATDQHASSGGSLNKTLETELNNIKERLLTTEAALKEEKRMNRSLKHSLKDGDPRSSVNINSEINLEEQQKELDDMRQMYETELQDLNLKLQASERAMVEVRHGSNLGAMEDDDDIDRVISKRQREEVAILKEQLQTQLNTVEKQMSGKLEKQERKWSKKVQNMSKEHAEELNKLNNALEKTNQTLVQSQSNNKPDVKRQLRDNEDLVRKSREQEKLLNSLEEEMIKTEELRKSAEFQRKQQEKKNRLTTEETTVETFINKRSRSPGLQASPTRSPGPRSASRSRSPRIDRSRSPRIDRSRSPQLQHQKTAVSMYPSDDEDESTAMFSGTGSMRGTGTLQSTYGSNRSPTMGTREFVEQLRKNPTLDIMRKEFNALLDEKLENIGVNPKHPGISDTVLDYKLTMLKTQRQSLDKKYVDFVRLRQHLDMLATSKAKEKYKEMKRSPPLASRTLQGSRNHSPVQNDSRRTFSQQPTSSGGPSPRPRGTGSGPVPTPRSRSPNKNLQSTGSTTEWTSTQWDSDEDSEEEDSLRRDVKPLPLAASPNRSGPSAAPRLIQSRPLTNPVMDDDWDSDSDDYSSPKRPVVQPKVIISKPRGDNNVSRLSQSIEMQLNNRGANRKPAGAVDTMKSTEPFDVSDLESDDDDAFKPTTQKRPPTRGSHNETDFSTNTYGTSQWGSSSKGVSSVHDRQQRPQSKSSFVSVTDVSSDEDLDLENI